MKIKLSEIAHGRSGDKGDSANIGIIAFEPKGFEILETVLTAQKVKDYFKGICMGEVYRYELKNILALNFVLTKTLGGGGTTSLKFDAQGKTLAAILLQMEIEI